MTTTYHPDPAETRDAKLIDEAFALLDQEQFERAKQLAAQVARRTPSSYANVITAPNGSIAVKSWDRDAFLHYCVWERQHGSAPQVDWVPNAYPRAHFALGFIAVAQERPADAIGHLDDGERLDPENPQFNLERAQVHIKLGDVDRAFACLTLVDKPGPFVTPSDVAVSLRGRSQIHIVRRDFGQAEAACRRALQLEPRNQIAVLRLAYIDHLRKGGAPIEVSLRRSPTQALVCSKCGGPLANGRLRNDGGQVRFLCASCLSNDAPRAEH